MNLRRKYENIHITVSPILNFLNRPVTSPPNENSTLINETNTHKRLFLHIPIRGSIRSPSPQATLTRIN